VRRIRQSAECRFGRIEAAGRNAAPDDGCRSDGDGCCDHGREANCRPAATAARRALLALWAGSRDGDPRRDGACATIENRQSTRVDCGASRAQARVLAVTVAGDGRQCPRNADRILAVADTVTETACLRSLAAPHAGDAGKGGGILLPGDCIADPAGGLARPEIPCVSATDYAKVAAIALASAQCPRSTVDTVRLATAADYRTACLVTGPGVMTKGDCVTDPVVTQFVEVRCDTPEAAFRVTARVAAVRACPAGSADTAGRTTRCRGRPSRVCAGADVTVVAHAARRGLCATQRPAGRIVGGVLGVHVERAVTAGLACLALAALAPGCGGDGPAAEGTWQTPVEISVPADDTGGRQVAVDARGNAVAVWMTSVDANTVVQAAQRPAGGRWSKPVRLSAAGGSTHAYAPQIAVDRRGNAVAVWQRSSASSARHRRAEPRAVRRPLSFVESTARSAGGSWQPPTRVSRAGSGMRGRLSNRGKSANKSSINAG